MEWSGAICDLHLSGRQEEAKGGDKDAAEMRLTVLDGLDVLSIGSEVQALAHKLIEEGPLPEKAAVDALHIALAATHNM